QILPSFEDVLSESNHRHLVVRKANASLDDVGKQDFVGGLVVQPNRDNLRVEDFLNFVADEVVNPLHVHLGDEAFLDAVDDGEFRIALLGFLEQALSFVEKPRIFERDTHAGGNGGQEANLRFPERVVARMVLYDDGTDEAIAADDRNLASGTAGVGASNGD